YDRIEGWTTFDAWRGAGLRVASVEMQSPVEAAERLARGALLLDVRQHAEWAEGRIPGATHLEVGDIIAGKKPEATEFITYCAHGERSATAASLLERHGAVVANLRGGIAAWRRAGLALEP
ncbi:MAG TPA: rhodanese-like domain-containing protein, partial [Actinomycetota bacterium]